MFLERFYGYRRSESVKDVIYGLGRVNFKYLLLIRTVKFYQRLYFKSGLLHDIFWSFLIFNCDDYMKTVFIPLHKAISNLLSQFYDYVFGNDWLYFFVYICMSLSVSASLANKRVHISDDLNDFQGHFIHLLQTICNTTNYCKVVWLWHENINAFIPDRFTMFLNKLTPPPRKNTTNTRCAQLPVVGTRGSDVINQYKFIILSCFFLIRMAPRVDCLTSHVLYKFINLS